MHKISNKDKLILFDALGFFLNTPDSYLHFKWEDYVPLTSNS